jgi:LytS/YehU family sensor histidine kinase
MKRKIQLYELFFITFCCIFGLFSKRLISPLTNVLTDFARIPGGSLATGFSLMFLVIGSALVNSYFVGTLMGFVQGMLALFLGMTGYQGILCILTFSFPGLIIDLVNLCYRKKDSLRFLLGCVLGKVGSALLSNLLIFHLKSVAGLLWILLAACSGIAGGFMAKMLFEGIRRILPYTKGNQL